jgi:hypothetical protein
MAEGFQEAAVNQPNANTAIVTDDIRQKLLNAVTEQLSIGVGRGSSANNRETLLTQHDRFGQSAIQINSENVGLTFFTKPRLNMHQMSIRQDPTLALLDTLDPENWMFALRCNLDTVFAKSPIARDIASLCPWFNDTSAFNIPLSNMLSGISGWPDFSVEYETTESGTFSEDMTLVRGSDHGRRTYDLSCTFRDIQGGFLMSYFYYWILAMALQMEGSIVAYPEDRAANRLNYTISIYRFVMDPSMRTITKWAKATGCYPVNIPIGDVFNYGPGDSFVHTSQQFTIPFKANIIKYMDPRDLADFNTLVARYGWQNEKERLSRVKTEVKAGHNFAGLPWIDLVNGTNELSFLALKEEVQDVNKDLIEKIRAQITAQTPTTPAIAAPAT